MYTDSIGYNFFVYLPIKISEKYIKKIKECLKDEKDLENLQIKIPVSSTYYNVRNTDNNYYHYAKINKNNFSYNFVYNHNCEHIIVICNNKIFTFEKDFLKLDDKDINVIYEDIKLKNRVTFQHYSKCLKSKEEKKCYSI